MPHPPSLSIRRRLARAVIGPSASMSHDGSAPNGSAGSTHAVPEPASVRPVASLGRTKSSSVAVEHECRAGRESQLDDRDAVERVERPGGVVHWRGRAPQRHRRSGAFRLACGSLNDRGLACGSLNDRGRRGG